ncbi:hypothetical protein [Clostridium estertheticum]|uniref:hypothetical protein n=1 Tax=Clostridium estertheticum TaxID=238834 RepID=UPI001CF5E72B|nr:hypothetical protein [Clostridium estertheticum]MCB2362187.1 hypothetical protein [Clostridium estertheticum]
MEEQGMRYVGVEESTACKSCIACAACVLCVACLACVIPIVGQGATATAALEIAGAVTTSAAVGVHNA